MNSPIKVLAVANHGGMIGLLMYPIMTVQSKVSGNNPRPVMGPKSWLTITLSGAIQVIQPKKERPVKIQPGNQYFSQISIC